MDLIRSRYLLVAQCRTVAAMATTALGDLHLVAQLLGHASVATTQVYALVSVERRAAAVTAIA